MNYKDIRELLLPEIKAKPVTPREFFTVNCANHGGTETRCLTRDEQQQAIVQTVVRQFSDWRSVGEFANEIVARLERRLDTDWITEYLAWIDIGKVKRQMAYTYPEPSESDPGEGHG